MALQSSGRINLKQIATEYTDTAPHNMSEFYNGGSAGVSSNLVPSSGAIYLSDFYGATASTIVDSSSATVLLVKAAGSGLENDAITYQNSSDVSTGFTETGDPQAGTFSPYRSGGYSVYLTSPITVSGNANLAFGTSDFTVEAWVFLFGATTIYDGRPSSTNGSYFRMSATTTNWQVYINGSTRIDTTTNYSQHEWHHVVYSRTGGTGTLYIDGQSVGTYSDSTNYINGSSRPIIGASGYSGSTDANAYIRDLRVVNGTAVYTSTFTPPTETLSAITNTDLLICHLPYFADGSTNGYTLTTNAHTVPFGPYDYSPWTADDVGGSVYFDGSGDFLETGPIVPLTGNFTIETWVNISNAASSRREIFSQYSGGEGRLTLYSKTDSTFEFFIGTSLGNIALTSSTFQINTWYHLAVVRNSNNYYFYVNGELEASDTGGKNVTIHNGDVDIGQRFSGDYMFGYISDLRVVSSAQYTSAFTPPTAPLSHTGSGTSLLMNNKSDANIYDAAAGNGLVSVEDPLYNEGVRSNTASRQFTTSSSMYWSGEGNYLQLVDHDDLFTFGTGDFTIEFWMRADATASGPNSPILIDFRNTFTASLAPVLYISVNSTDLKWFVNGSTRITGTSSFTTGTWYHIAVSRSSGSTKMFVDGTQVGSTYSDTNNYIVHTDRPVIGTNGGDVTSGHFQGRMQDIRITKGKGRYTAAFTPPTAEFEL